MLHFTTNVKIFVTDGTSEQLLVQRLAELQVKLQYLDSMYRARQEELLQLTQHIDQIGIASDNTSTGFTMPPAILRPEIKQLLKNMSGMHAASGLNPPIMLRLPSSFHFLPHLLDDPTSLRLAYLLSKGRSGVSIVLGIPTVRREKQSYLMETLQNLVEGMNSEEAEDAVLVVFIAETDMEYVLQVAKEVELRFPAQIDSGLIEVIAPSPSYYPDLDKLRITLGDSRERVRWRSKQNLDFAFLMSYSQPKGTFYVQLEDDILAKPYYISEMKKFAIEKTARKEPWFVLDFCQLGFIGSVKGRVLFTRQKIAKITNDKQFGKVALFFPHSNPDAEVISGIKFYKQYSLERAYLGETFFWGLLPQPGDQLIFKFTNPILMKRFFFRSGNAEHPSDKFYNTTVEVFPIETNQYVNTLNMTSDGFIVVGKSSHNVNSQFVFVIWN
ncbi:hypothetical protein FQR65_LT01353 [Abscondita terminalis]|nr:hypothetical protein FQR65_LT01353 [Abscondita terminalis]